MRGRPSAGGIARSLRSRSVVSLGSNDSAVRRYYAACSRDVSFGAALFLSQCWRTLLDAVAEARGYSDSSFFQVRLVMAIHLYSNTRQSNEATYACTRIHDAFRFKF